VVSAVSAWPPSRDRTLWIWIAVGHALPLAAWAIGAAFWVHGAEVGPFRPTSPLTWMVGQPLVALTLRGQRARPFAVAIVVQACIGLVLIATLLQAPTAYLNVGREGSGLEELTYLRLAPSTLLAVATGMAFVGQAAVVLRLGRARSSARSIGRAAAR
jgi:hypothetical protein